MKTSTLSALVVVTALTATSGALAQDAAAGKTSFNKCLACHAIGEGAKNKVGPVLNGLFGSRVTLANGETVVADNAYIRESVLNPQAKIVAGFPPIMPTFQGLVTEEQLLELIEYVKSLQALPQVQTR